MSSKYINEMQIFGKQLKILMQEVGIKQKELAELAEMNDSNISRLAGGTSTPTLKFILLLAYTYGVNLNWLLIDKGPMLLKDIGEDPETKSLAEGIAAEVLRLRSDVNGLQDMLTVLQARNEWMKDI